MTIRKRLAVAVVSGAVVFGFAFAFAAALDLGSQNLAAGDRAVTSCDPDGVVATYAVGHSAAGYTVPSVTVTGIATTCNGQTVGVTLTDGAGASLGSGTATAGTTGSVTITLATPPLAKNVANVHAVIHG